MRKLNQSEIRIVSGALSADQVTYFATVSAQAVVSLGFQFGLKVAGVVAPGLGISYGVGPLLSIISGALTTEACNQYFASAK